MEDIRAITLDLDDTLWPIEPVIETAENRLYEWLSANCPGITPSHTIETMRAARLEIVRTHTQIAHDVTEVRRRSLHRILVVEGGYPDGYVDQAMEEFLIHRNNVELYPDVLPFLTSARERYPLLSVSNGNADLHQIGLGDLFVRHVSARDVGAAKPDARMFQAACEHLGLIPAQVLHIGDHPVQDILGAARLGMKTVWVNRNGVQWDEGAGADHEVSSLERVLDLLPLNKSGVY
ncbi:MAG: HAD family hydrolase [Gammaproteobacteria bacterium]|nr:HAD family hydrolase [Gammaproteobacteria bacterium]